VIRWRTGWTTKITKEGDQYKKTVYRKGQALDVRALVRCVKIAHLDYSAGQEEVLRDIAEWRTSGIRRYAPRHLLRSPPSSCDRRRPYHRSSAGFSMIACAHRARGVFGSVLGHGALLDRASRVKTMLSVHQTCLRADPGRSWFIVNSLHVPLGLETYGSRGCRDELYVAARSFCVTSSAHRCAGRASL
jgi:hypothetical protein